MSPILLTATQAPSEAGTPLEPLGSRARELPVAQRRAYQRRGRIMIQSVLRENDAQHLFHCLSEEVEWGLRLGSGPGVGWQYATAHQYQQMDATQRRTLQDMACRFSGTRGSHHYQVRPIAHDEFERATDASPLARFVDALNSPTVLAWLRRLTGAADISRIAAQATRFHSGDFFAPHSDADEADRQRATCVFYFSPQWQQQWGGLLAFKNQQGGTDEAYLPLFNSMSLFRYSQEHEVTQVTPLAAQPRYAIAAALMAD